MDSKPGQIATGFNLVVIGGGPGGYVAALRAADLGASVALVERQDIGGTCLNRGCIPTKALLESARLIRGAGRAAEMGVHIDGVRPDPTAMAARSRRIVDLLRKGVEDLLAQRRVVVMRGTARLGAAGRVEIVSDSVVQAIAAESVIVASGSRWIDLPGVPADGKRVITSDDALDLRETGGRMVIVGGGAVGCEMAEIYSALGTEVTIVEMMAHVLPTEDGEIAKRLEAALKRKGIAVITSARVAQVAVDALGVTVALQDGKQLPADRVLVGVGRRANVENLGLEAVGVAFGKKGISTDSRLRTNVPGVYAVGDVTGEMLLAHVATAQGLVAAENACGQNSEINYGSVPRCVYTDPEFAGVGLTESEALARGGAPHVYRLRLGRIGRAVTLGDTFGLAKIVCDGAGGRILGFHVLAPHASELVAEAALAIKLGLRPGDVADVIHPHPTLSEIVWEAASGAAGRHVHGD
jgi:dihydrolipoamide dehydrogenase